MLTQKRFEIFTQLGTIRKHHETMYREEERLFHLHFYEILVRNPVLLSDSEILRDIFLKLGTNVKYDQKMSREVPEIQLHFYKIMPHCKSKYGNRVRSIAPKPFEMFLRNLLQI